jgi:predicted Zn-dependent protease
MIYFEKEASMAMKNNVSKLGMLIFLSVLIIGALSLAGCGDTTGQETSPVTKHYAKNGISFDYPNTWGPGNSSSPNAIAALVSNEEALFIVILKETMPDGYTLKRFNDETVMSFNPTQIISGSFPTVDGVSACDTVFQANDSQMRFVILEKNGSVYVIICSAPVTTFDGAQNSFNMVINSFKVQ